MGLIFISISSVIGLFILNTLFSNSLSGTINPAYSFGLFCVYTFLFWGVFLVITLAYPEFFIYYLNEHTTIPFYISDINALAYHFFQNILFFSWVIWPPFIIIGVLSIINSSLTCYEYAGAARYAGFIVYSHIISIILTYLDIFPFLQQYFEASAVLWFDMLDYGAYVFAFRGTFLDVSVTLNAFWFVFSLFSNYNVNTINYSYIYLSNSQIFWSTFYVVWLCRGSYLFIVVYFFSGAGIFSNTISVFITVVSIEVLIILIRSSAKFLSWNAL